jgi:nitrite reductase/ring-hydroxylating ferredoxin subunit
MCSSVNPQKRCAVVPDDPNLTATDPCSGAKFSLFDGSPVKAPAARSLKQYRVIITNFDLMVVN